MENVRNQQLPLTFYFRLCYVNCKRVLNMPNDQNKIIQKIFDLSVELTATTYEGYHNNPDIARVKDLANRIHKLAETLP